MWSLMRVHVIYIGIKAIYLSINKTTPYLQAIKFFDDRNL